MDGLKIEEYEKYLENIQNFLTLVERNLKLNKKKLRYV